MPDEWLLEGVSLSLLKLRFECLCIPTGILLEFPCDLDGLGLVVVSWSSLDMSIPLQVPHRATCTHREFWCVLGECEPFCLYTPGISSRVVSHHLEHYRLGDLFQALGNYWLV